MGIPEILAGVSVGISVTSLGLSLYALSLARRAERLARAVRGWDLAAKSGPRTFPVHHFDPADIKPMVDGVAERVEFTPEGDA